MKLAFYGSSLLSSYWNGAATYYRGVLSELHRRGWEITFYEPDAYDRQAHRDIDPPPYARSVVYENSEAAARRVLAEARDADVVVKASGVGVFDDLLMAPTRSPCAGTWTPPPPWTRCARAAPATPSAACCRASTGCSPTAAASR